MNIRKKEIYMGKEKGIVEEKSAIKASGERHVKAPLRDKESRQEGTSLRLGRRRSKKRGQSTKQQSIRECKGGEKNPQDEKSHNLSGSADRMTGRKDPRRWKKYQGRGQN